MSGHPFVKWFGRDWLGDPLLHMVGPAEKGIWMDLLCAMMQGEPYGHLAVNGKPMSDEDAARLTGTDIGTYKGLLSRIESLGISSRTADGMLYCRRLVRDYEKFKTASESGKKGGGNPLLNQKKPKSRSQKPEATLPLAGTHKPPFIPTFIGQEIDCGKWTEQVKSVIACRPEFARLRPDDVAKELIDTQDNPRMVVNLGEFCRDAANSVETPRNPLGMLRAYLNSTKGRGGVGTGASPQPLSPAEEEYAQEAAGCIRMKAGRDIGRLWMKIDDALGREATARVKARMRELTK